MATVSRLKVAESLCLDLHWLQFATRFTFLRAAIVAMLIGSILTLVNQPGWIVGSNPLQVLPLILVFLIPFCVVTVSQVLGARQAYIDSVELEAVDSVERFVATVASHGIPARAVAIGLVFGSINLAIVLSDALLRSDDLGAISVLPLGQAYVLPFLFGLLSQTISYRRSRFHSVIRLNSC